jgi:hypothetical protein
MKLHTSIQPHVLIQLHIVPKLHIVIQFHIVIQITKRRLDKMTTSSESNKLPEGWHDTSNYGQVFVTPDGSAWKVHIFSYAVMSFKVPVTKDDIMHTSAIDKMKQAQAMRNYRKLKSPNTQKPNTSQEDTKHD